MNIESCSAFGWVVHRVRAPAGERFDLRVARETSHSRLSAQTLYTAGRITGHYADDESHLALERVPGFATDSLPDPLPALHLCMEVQTDAEWWCVSAPTNKALPAVSFVRATPNAAAEIQAGARLLVCHGTAVLNGQTLRSPLAVRTVEAATLVAVDGPVYAMCFDRDNATP